MAEVVHIAAVKLQFESGTGWHVADLQTLPNAKEVLSRMIMVSRQRISFQSSYIDTIKWPWVTQALYDFGLGCIKASIVALYLRLAITPLQRKVLWVAFFFVLAQGMAATIVSHLIF